MCLGLPGRIIEINNKTCIVDVLGVSREISVELLKDVVEGDYVLIHAGCAIAKMNEEEAVKTLELFEELKELSNDKLL